MGDTSLYGNRGVTADWQWGPVPPMAGLRHGQASFPDPNSRFTFRWPNHQVFCFLKWGRGLVIRRMATLLFFAYRLQALYKTIKGFCLHILKAFYIKRIFGSLRPEAPVLYRLYKTLHIHDYWLKYTDPVQIDQGILSGHTFMKKWTGRDRRS